MKEEEDSLRSHRTWSEDIYSIPDGRKSVGTKWIFKLKHNELGRIVRYKARLVAKGFSQVEGQDYTDTFAPVMQSTTLRSLLSLAASENYELHQIDVKTAFLYGDLDEDIYIKLPDGTIRKLQKAMYGLKQASRQFYKRFNASLTKFGLTRCDTDPCCYFRNVNDQQMYVIIHVDDAVIIGDDIHRIEALKAALREEYVIEDMGEVKYCGTISKGRV